MSRPANSAPVSRSDRTEAFKEPTCAGWLSVVQSHLRETLVPADALRRLHTVASRLPGDCLTALEARLGANSDRVDLSVRLIDRARASSLAERFAASRLESFVPRWSRRDPDLDQVRSIWLELDLDREPIGLPDPVICTELSGQVEPDWVLDSLLPALDRGPPSGARRRLISRCLSSMPAPGELLYVFALGARRLDATRLEFCGIEPAAMVAYLEAVAPADMARRLAELAPLVAGCDRYHLSIDVDEEIAPRVGLEASFRGLPHRESGWARLVDRLVECGLCLPKKRDALFAWPGWDSPRTAPNSWPAAARHSGSFCARCLSHVKLVSCPGREPQAKVYLLFEALDKTVEPLPRQWRYGDLELGGESEGALSMDGNA